LEKTDKELQWNTFTLSAQGYFGNTVEVIEVTPTSFTLTAKDGQHSLKGTVTHQVIKDSNGELWLRHTGAGIENEGEGRQILNYTAADQLWNKMGYNTNRMLNGVR